MNSLQSKIWTCKDSTSHCVITVPSASRMAGMPRSWLATSKALFRLPMWLVGTSCSYSIRSGLQHRGLVDFMLLHLTIRQHFIYINIGKNCQYKCKLKVMIQNKFPFHVGYNKNILLNNAKIFSVLMNLY